MKRILSIALLGTLALAGSVNDSLIKSEKLLENISKTEKKLQEKLTLNYITKEDISTLNKELETYKQELEDIKNSDFENANPKEVENLIKKITTISTKITQLNNEITQIATLSDGDEPKTRLVNKSIELLNNIAQNLEEVSNTINLLNLPPQIRGNIVLDQATITENAFKIQEFAQRLETKIFNKRNKIIYNKTQKQKIDEVIVAAQKSIKEEKQKEQDEKDRQKKQQQQQQQQEQNNNNQNPLMGLMGGMMGGGMMGGMMNNQMMGGMTQGMGGMLGGMMGGGQQGGGQQQ